MPSLFAYRDTMPQLPGAEVASAKKQKRSHENASVSGSSTSDESTRERKRKRKEKKNGTKSDRASELVNVNGHRRSAFEERRNSLGKAARDPRDEPSYKKRITAAGQGIKVRSPSPVIDEDGLSRPG